MRKEIKIEGMSCKHCVMHVTEALEEIDGVKNVKVSLEKQNAILEAENVNDEALKKAIEEVGYDVVNIKTI